MLVRLISYTQPAEYIKNTNSVENMTELVAFCARVSNPTNQNNKETSEKLIKYLIKHQHWSPLEMASACLEIETTRDIARQILRHRSFSFQEFSQRYADPTKDLSCEAKEARLQDPKNRQNSIPLDFDVEEHRRLNERFLIRQHILWDHAQEIYKWAIGNGIAKEQARSVLPEGMTISRLYMHGTLRSWIHYCDVRMDPSTQKEHKEIATACLNEIAKILPMITNIKGVE